MSFSFSFSESSVIITGASSGLGAIFARQLAPLAKNLVLVGRNETALHELRDTLRVSYPGLSPLAVTADLATDSGRAHLWGEVAKTGLSYDVLINNAGLGDYGWFASSDEARIRQQIEVNITALTMLTSTFLSLFPDEAGRSGAIINVSSLAGELPLPDLAVYAATKAYVTSLSEALSIELAARRIRVLAVCPGPTPTNFSKTARREDGDDVDRTGQAYLKMPPERVVGEAIAAAEAGRYVVFPGLRVTLAATFFRRIPRGLRHWILTRRFERSAAS